MQAAPGVENASVEVRVEHCSADLQADRLSAALEVELKNLDPELVEYIRRSTPRAKVTCSLSPKERTVYLEVTTTDGTVLKESLESSDRGAERFIAIAISESLAARAALTMEREQTPTQTEAPAQTQAVEEPNPVPATPQKPASTDHYPTYWARASLGGRWFGEPGFPSAAGRVGADAALSHEWSLGTQLELTRGSGRVDAGELRAQTLSLGAVARYRVGTGRFVIAPGVGARGGGLRWKGVPSDPATTKGASGYGFWMGPLGNLLLGVNLTSHLRIEIDAEVGLNPVPVRATQSSDVVGSAGDTWTSLQLGAAVQL